MMSRTKVFAFCLIVGAFLVAQTSTAQWPYAPPGPSAPPSPLPPPSAYDPAQAPVSPQAVPQGTPGPQYQGPEPAVPQQQTRQPQQSQQGQQYAFRPDLSNPEFGECLGMEKNWKNLYHQYSQGYQQAQSMHPSDPRYAQMTQYLVDLKRRLDSAWYYFSNKCIYFPAPRR